MRNVTGLTVIRPIYPTPARTWMGRPIHRLCVEFTATDKRGRWRGVPVQGDHVPAPHAVGGVRDKRQTYLDECRLDIAIAAANEPSRPGAPHTGPMFVEATACIPRPQSHYGTRKADRDTLTPEAMIDAPHVAIGGSGRGDGDKMCRFVWDALNGKVAGGVAWYDDDSQISQWQGRRVWIPKWEPPRVELVVIALTASAVVV